MRSSTGYVKTTWWDGTTQIDGYGNPGSDITPLKTTAAGTKVISLSSCTVAGVVSGSLSYFSTLDPNYRNIDASGCTGIAYLGAANQSEPTGTFINATGCTSLNTFNSYGSTSLKSVLFNGCSALVGVTTGNCSSLSSLEIVNAPFLNYLDIYSCSLSSLNLQGSTLSSANGANINCSNNRLKNIDLTGLKLNTTLNVSQNPVLSSLILPTTNVADCYEVNASNCNLSSLNMTSLTGLYQFQVSNNRLTSIGIPAGWGGRPGYVAYNIGIQSNNLNATALNNFFTALGTYIGSYGTYGEGGIIYYGGNPGSDTCNPSIASAKGWQPQNA